MPLVQEALRACSLAAVELYCVEKLYTWPQGSGILVAYLQPGELYQPCSPAAALLGQAPVITTPMRHQCMQALMPSEAASILLALKLNRPSQQPNSQPPAQT